MTAVDFETQQAALDISDYADAADVPIVRFVDVEDALSPAFERPALIVLPPQPLCRLGPPVLDQNSPLPTCEEDAPAFYLDVRPRTQWCQHSLAQNAQGPGDDLFRSISPRGSVHSHLPLATGSLPQVPRFRFEGVHSIPTLAQHVQTVARKASMCERRSILVELVSMLLKLRHSHRLGRSRQIQPTSATWQRCMTQVLVMSEAIVRVAPLVASCVTAGCRTSGGAAGADAWPDNDGQKRGGLHRADTEQHQALHRPLDNRRHRRVAHCHCV